MNTVVTPGLVTVNRSAVAGLVRGGLNSYFQVTLSMLLRSDSIQQ